ncbi:AAA family ATPase, partial [Streptomyces sp. NPDC089733]|uniref:AAA family ATPase n=1 Tax=Streptomyces sp. NPDC089733 TaxID=3365918 RepID=UPI0037F6E729
MTGDGLGAPAVAPGVKNGARSRQTTLLSGRFVSHSARLDAREQTLHVRPPGQRPVPGRRGQQHRPGSGRRRPSPGSGVAVAVAGVRVEQSYAPGGLHATFNIGILTSVSSVAYVVISGLPGSGKSTLARSLAERLSLPLIDKDVILESLYDSLGVGDHAWRSRLSRASDDIM